MQNRWLATCVSMAIFFVGEFVYLMANVDHPNFNDVFAFLVFQGFGLPCLILGPIYFLPTIIGLYNRNILAIFILNLFLGWTGIGWVAALVWSVLKEPSIPNPAP